MPCGIADHIFQQVRQRLTVWGKMLRHFDPCISDYEIGHTVDLYRCSDCGRFMHR